MAINRDYFKDQVEWDGTSAYPPEFQHMPDLAGFEAAPGLTLRPFWGQGLMASYVTFDPGAVAPAHQHPQEQMSVVLYGSLYFTVGTESRWIEAGDIVSIPPHVPHAAQAGDEGALCIDMFSPPRDGFRELVEGATQTKADAE